MVADRDLSVHLLSQDHLPLAAPSPRPSCTATGMERNPIGDKKRPISPLAIIAVKRFSFEGIDKRQDFCASKNPRAGTTPAEVEADKSLTIVSESLQAKPEAREKTPSIIWSDNIDGCEPEKTFL